MRAEIIGDSWIGTLRTPPIGDNGVHRCTIGLIHLAV